MVNYFINKYKTILCKYGYLGLVAIKEDVPKWAEKNFEEYMKEKQ